LGLHERSVRDHPFLFAHANGRRLGNRMQQIPALVMAALREVAILFHDPLLLSLAELAPFGSRRRKSIADIACLGPPCPSHGLVEPDFPNRQCSTTFSRGESL